MIYLILAIISSASISILMRISEKYMKNEMAMFMANYGVCMMLSLLFMKDVAQVGQQFASAGFVTLGLGVLSGIMYLANFLFYKYNMKENGIVMSATFMKLGVLVPTIMAVLVFGEKLTGLRFAGIAMAVVAIVIIHFEKDAISKSKHVMGLLLLLLLSGFTDSLANVFEKMGAAESKDIYLLVTFGTAFFITIFVILYKKVKVGKMELLFGALIGLPNYFSSRFLLLALEEVDAVLVYPTYSVATMIVIMLAGVCAFQEKIGKKKLVALAMILVALGLLNS